MLIRFRVKNFLSFKDEAQLSMIPGKTRQHAQHILSGGESRHAVDILRGAVIYGANASGKSNLVKAIDFAKDLITNGTKARQPLHTKPFKLDLLSAASPSRFEFEIRTSGKDYLYGFELDSTQILSEWLYELKLTKEELLYHRKTSSEGQTSMEFGGLKLKSAKERDFLEFIAMGTRPNQLFLTEANEKNVRYFTPVFLWFEKSLVIIFPESHYDIIGSSSQKIALLAKYLELFDTGICGINLRPLALNEISLSNIPNQLMERIKKDDLNDKIFGVFGPRGERFYFSLNEDGELMGQELIFKHRREECQDEVEFDVGEESDGSLRLLDLIPMLYTGRKHETVFIIDELDRSLHPHLCHQLIKLFFEHEGELTQFIVTTHESGLLNLDLLRRDEIWFTEKDAQGATQLYSLEEFTPRYDKDIQKGYLLGRFGAIPVTGNAESQK